MGKGGSMDAGTRKTTALIAFTILALVAGACAPTQEQPQSETDTKVPDEIVIGATLPLTGEEADVGGYFKEGYELAFKEVNDAGGLQLGDQKVPVTLNLLDDTTNQQTAANLAQKLIDDGAHALLGTYSTDLVQAQSTVAEQNQMPYVNGGGAATAIYQRGYKWIFGALAPIQSLATSQMEWIDTYQNQGKLPTPAEIAVIWENTSHGEDYLKGIQQFSEQSGGDYRVVMDESFELNTKDYSAVLGKVEAQGVDFFMADAHLPDFLTMHRQYIARGLCHDIITYGARGSEQDAVEVIGQQNVNYILSAVWWNDQLAEHQPEVNEHFISLFEREYDRTPEWYGALSYDTARALFTAIEGAGGADKEAVREELVNLKMTSVVPTGTLSFPEETGYQADYPFLVQQNLPNGSSPIIYPDELATGRGIPQNPNCKT
jgi:branched-chain amino acid transport system substrate-binding protein